MAYRKELGVAFAALATALLAGGGASAWTLEEAAKPYAGTEINVVFLDRPGYRAAIKMLPDFEKKTGIKVKYDIVPYENSRERQVLDFTAKGDLDIALVDLVWMGEFAESGWIVPMDTFLKDPKLADPNFDKPDLFPLLLEAFGSWNGVAYGVPFDNYSGLLFYNRCMLDKAGFKEPPKTWTELKDVFGPKLTSGDQQAFALQSRRGETQSADSFMRVLWPFGGSLLDDKFRSNLMSQESQAGLQFRQDLMKYMPQGIVDYDHAEAVNALAQGKVAMITEWSAFYGTLVDPASSKIIDCLEVAPEPAGPAGRKPALGGFSLAVTSQASDKEKAAAWLFIQWVTAKENAKTYVENGGVSGRQSVYKDPQIAAKYKFVKPMVESWQAGVPHFRPRFPEWPEISEVIGEWGTKIMLGTASLQEGSKEIGQRMESVLERAGYYKPGAKLLQ